MTTNIIVLSITSRTLSETIPSPEFDQFIGDS
jgi:hypothetical protein